ncbi:ABC transporter ATP-binding protein [Teredinibacter turnerae]|uniref:ABC transporter ATP-binding protein n=1 Tax=Teredinibacter turnerae TaxID=2426 RepID=UPI00041172E9|nr:ABC transporter ATP-binding protein [Teredinibacter turnerae]
MRAIGCVSNKKVIGYIIIFVSCLTINPIFIIVVMSKPASPSHQNDGKCAVELHDLQFSYGQGRQSVLNIDKWQLPQGESAFIYGPSGSGKSTLLNLLGGLLIPTNGAVNVLGTEISKLSGPQRDKFRARHIGIIFQQFNLIPWLTVADNIAVAHHFSGRKAAPKGEMVSRAAELLEKLGLAKEVLQHKTRALSIGQQQRVAIARALINAPELIIADEPTSALDTESRNDFMALLMACVKESCASIVFVSHDRSLARYFNTELNLTSLNAVPDIAQSEGASHDS